MDLGVAFVADQQATEPVQPRQGSLRDPTVASEPLARLDTLAGDTRADMSLPKRTAVGARDVAQIAVHLRRPSARSATSPANRPDAVDHRDERDDIGDVRRREPRRREGRAVAVGDHVVFRAEFAAVGGIRPRRAAPLFAGACAESTAARDQSRPPTRWSRARSTARIWSQTPARCQSRRRRQQVTPEHPSSWGTSSHGMPVRRTKTIPARAARSDAGGAPAEGRRRSLRKERRNDRPQLVVNQ